jgi:hypothetical protein
MARYLEDGSGLIAARVDELAALAVRQRPPWMLPLGQAPADPELERQWLRHVAIIAAYREQFEVTTDDPRQILGPTPNPAPRRTSPTGTLSSPYSPPDDSPDWTPSPRRPRTRAPAPARAAASRTPARCAHTWLTKREAGIIQHRGPRAAGRGSMPSAGAKAAIRCSSSLPGVIPVNPHEHARPGQFLVHLAVIPGRVIRREGLTMPVTCGFDEG